MGSRAALGDGPVSFFVAASRTQVSIPLTALLFDDTGTVLSASAPYNTALYAGLDVWLNYLARSGRIYPGDSRASGIAMVLQAADLGAVGNNIQVTVNYPDPAHPDQFTVNVVEQVTYENLRPADVATQVGTTEAPGLQPGPVLLQVGQTPSLPTNDAPTKTDATEPAGGAPTPATFAIKCADGTSFVLQARKAGAWGDNLAVTIPTVNTAAGTFTLFAQWHLLAPVDATALTAAVDLHDLSTEVTFTPAPGQIAFLAPQAGTITLGGGIDPASASYPLRAKT